MKVIKLFAIGMFLLLASSVKAQVAVSINIGTPPPWGPAGYTEVRYYYLPDVEAYYDVQTSMFIYFGNGHWIHRRYLPTRYRDYDLYSGYKVVMTDYHGTAPYSNFRDYRTRYARGYHGESQRSIGERPARGNVSHESNRTKSNGAVRGEGPRNNKNNSRGNEKNTKDNHGHEGGNERKK